MPISDLGIQKVRSYLTGKYHEQGLAHGLSFEDAVMRRQAADSVDIIDPEGGSLTHAFTRHLVEGDQQREQELHRLGFPANEISVVRQIVRSYQTEEHEASAGPVRSQGE